MKVFFKPLSSLRKLRFILILILKFTRHLVKLFLSTIILFRKLRNKQCLNFINELNGLPFLEVGIIKPVFNSC